jgi:hypothetical protein
MTDKKGEEKPEAVLKERVKELEGIIKAAVDAIYKAHLSEEDCKFQKAIIKSANEALYDVQMELSYYEEAAAASKTNPECVEKSTR